MTQILGPDNDAASELYGRFIKDVPLQYPSKMTEFEIFRLRTAFEFAPYVIIATLVICYSLLTVAQSTDQAAVVWLILSNI